MGLANPWGLLALGAIGVLVWLHRWARRRREVPAGTLFLWRQVPPAPYEPRRVRLDLSFLLQAAILIALVGAVVRPWIAGDRLAAPARRLCLVLDVSASMQTVEGDGSRFDRARARARALVDELGSTDEVMLIAAGRRAAVLVRWTTDHVLVRQRLEALAARDTPGTLGPAVLLAVGTARARPGTRVVVLTDLTPASSGVDAEARAAVDWIAIGRADANRAVERIAVRRAPFQPLTQTRVGVTVRNHGRTAQQAMLRASIDDKPWTTVPVAMPPRGAATVDLGAPPAAGVLVVALDGSDVLAVDDRAAAWIAPSPALDLLVVADDPAPVEALRAAVAPLGGRVAEVSSRAYRPPMATGRVVVVSGALPAEPLPASVLYAMPEPGNVLCPVGRALEAAVVVDWESGHPTLAGLDELQSLEVVHARALETPRWATPVVLVAAAHAVSPVLVAGERDGRRVACLGLDLTAPGAASDHLPLTLLALGVLEWLAAPPDARADVVATGEPVPLPRVDPATAPEGLVAVPDTDLVIAERAGAMRLADGRRLIANLADARESDVGRDGDHEWPATRAAVEGARPAPGATRPLTRAFTAAALALLVVEWLVWWWRRTA